MNKIVALPEIGNENPSLEAALGYISRGWRVIPVNAADKKPWDPETNRLMSRWQIEATIDPTKIEKWFKRRPDLGVGIATGRKSGIVILDFDKSKGKDGPGDKAKLEKKYGKLPPTLTQSTPSGGTQEVYAYPAGAEDIPNAQGFGYAVIGYQGAKLCGIDVRGDGGQANVPPTEREAGAYRWHSDPITTPLAELPPRWSEALSAKALPAPKPTVFDDPDEAPSFNTGQGSLEAVLVACAACERAVTDPKNISEWHWKMVGGIAVRCLKGRETMRRISALDQDRYSPADTASMLDYMASKSGPHGCNAFAKEVPDACAGCLFRHKIKTPLELASEDVEFLKLQRRHFYAADVFKYYDVHAHHDMSEKSFSAVYAHVPIKFFDAEKGKMKAKSGSKNEAFTSNKYSPKVHIIRYMPGKADRIIKMDRDIFIGNTYMKDGVQPEYGDCSLWDDHMDWLIPNDEGQRDHLLDVMAHSFQKPGVKVKLITLLITESQRTGKSTISKAWGAMLGPSNVLPVSNEELASAFTGGIYNKQLVTFEELFIRGGDIYNTLKDLITEEEKRSQTKGVDFMTQNSPLNLLALSNKELPVMITEPKDGRWFVIKSDVEARRQGPWPDAGGAWFHPGKRLGSGGHPVLDGCRRQCCAGAPLSAGGGLRRPAPGLASSPSTLLPTRQREYYEKKKISQKRVEGLDRLEVFEKY